MSYKRFDVLEENPSFFVKYILTAAPNYHILEAQSTAGGRGGNA